MISIDWGATFKIRVPLSYLTPTGPGVYELDTEQFREDLLSLEQTFEGMAEPKTHLHNSTYIISGVEYARAIQILSPYSVEFEDGLYTVLLAGSNNNIGDVEDGILARNSVQVIPQNSAGLIVGDDGGANLECNHASDLSGGVGVLDLAGCLGVGDLNGQIDSEFSGVLTSCEISGNIEHSLSGSLGC